MSDFRYLDYEGLATYTEHVKDYADGKIVYISDESEIPNPPKEGTLYVIGSEILMDEEIIIGTQSGQTSMWTGKSIDTRLHDGKRIAYYLPYPSIAGNPISLTLELSDEDNTTVQTRVFAYGEVQGQKVVPGGSVIRMMYFERVIMNGAAASNCWICDGSIVLNNVVYGGTPVNGQVATFDGTNGTIKASGYTIASSVPANAKFTDSKYSFSGIPSGVTVTGPDTKYDVKTIPVVNFRLASNTATALIAMDPNANLIETCDDGDLFMIKVVLNQSYIPPANITQITLDTTSYSIYNCFDLSVNLKLQTGGEHYILCTKSGSVIKLLSYDDFGCIAIPNASNVNISTSSTSSSYPLVFTTNVTAGNKSLFTDSVNSLYYNPNTNTLTVPTASITTAKASTIANKTSGSTIAFDDCIKIKTSSYVQGLMNFKGSDHNNDVLYISGGSTTSAPSITIKTKNNKDYVGISMQGKADTASAAEIKVYGTSTSSYTTIQGGKNAAVTSDERLKDFGDNIEVDFNELKQIPKKYFTWKNDEIKSSNIGTSAQSIEKLYPELVITDDNGYKSLDYSTLSIVALAAIDKLNERIEYLENKLKEYEK